MGLSLEVERFCFDQILQVTNLELSEKSLHRVTLGIGQDLIHQNAIKRRERERIHELARRYTSMVSDARSQRAI